MSQILGIRNVAPPVRAPKAVCRTGNLASYAATGLLFTASMTGVLAISALLSLARVL